MAKHAQNAAEINNIYGAIETYVDWYDEIAVREHISQQSKLLIVKMINKKKIGWNITLFSMAPGNGAISDLPTEIIEKNILVYLSNTDIQAIGGLFGEWFKCVATNVALKRGMCIKCNLIKFHNWLIENIKQKLPFLKYEFRSSLQIC